MKDKNPSLCKSFNINISPTVRAQRDNLHGTEVNIIYLQKKKKTRNEEEKPQFFDEVCRVLLHYKKTCVGQSRKTIDTWQHTGPILPIVFHPRANIHSGHLKIN